MSHSPSRDRRRAKHDQTIGPERFITWVSSDKIKETLICGHVLVGMPTNMGVNHHPPKMRRCPLCKEIRTINLMGPLRRRRHQAYVYRYPHA